MKRLDSTEPQGPNRTRRLRAGIVTGAATRAASLASPLFIIPLAFDGLGEETYGIWMTVTALTSMLLWSDLGLGNGLLTKLSDAFARGDESGARGLIATAYALLGSLATTACASLVITAGLVPWGSVFNTSSSDVLPIVLITLCAFAINVPLGLIVRIQYALQEVAASNLLMMIGPTFSILGALVARAAHADSLVMIGLIVSGPPLASLVATAHVFRRHALLRPRLSDSRLRTVRPLLTLGSMFLVVQILSSVSLNADNLVVAHAVGPAAVADYSIAARIFMVVGLLISMLNLPLWPANAEAFARGEIDWVRRTTIRMTIRSAATMAVVGSGLTLLGRQLLRAWVSPLVDAPTTLLAGFAAFWFLVAIASPAFMVQNARGVLSPQVVGWLAFALVTIPVKVALAKTHIELLPTVAAATYLITMIPAALIGYRRAMQLGKEGE